MKGISTQRWKVALVSCSAHLGNKEDYESILLRRWTMKWSASGSSRRAHSPQPPSSLTPASTLFLALVLIPHCDTQHCLKIGEKRVRERGSCSSCFCQGCACGSSRDLLFLTSQPASGNTHDWNNALQQNLSYLVIIFCSSRLFCPLQVIKSYVMCSSKRGVKAVWVESTHNLRTLFPQSLEMGR